MPVEKIAVALGVSRQAVSLHAHKLGLPSRRGNYEPQKKGSDAMFRRMWEANVLVSEMREFFGLAHESCVKNRRRNMGLPPRYTPKGRTAQPHMSLEEFLQIDLAEMMKAEAGRMK